MRSSRILDSLRQDDSLHVGSTSDTASAKLSRTQEAMITLYLESAPITHLKHIRCYAYNPPRRNMPRTAIFCLGGSCNRQTGRIGMQRIIASAKIFGTAWPIRNLRRSIHTDGIVVSQEARTGLQEKMVVKTEATAQAVTNAPTTLRPSRTCGPGKMPK